MACPHKHEYTWQWYPQIVRVIMALGGFRAAPAIRVSQLQQCMPHQFFSEDFTAAMKVDSGPRALGRSLERTTTGNIEKRPIHDVVDKKRSIQMFSITPAGQTLIPVCSPAGVKSRHVQSLTVGFGEAYVDGNAHDLGGDVVLKDGSVLRNRCFIRNTASMVHKD